MTELLAVAAFVLSLASFFFSFYVYYTLGGLI